MELPKIGRPRKVKDGKELEKLINDYIGSCYQVKINDDGEEYLVNLKPVIMRSFCVFIGIHYDTLMEWEHNRPELAEPIKKLKEFCHSYLEEQLLNIKRPTIGCIFALKNNWGWKDTTEQKVTVTDNKIKFSFGIEEEENDQPTEE